MYQNQSQLYCSGEAFLVIEPYFRMIDIGETDNLNLLTNDLQIQLTNTKQFVQVALTRVPIQLCTVQNGQFIPLLNGMMKKLDDNSTISAVQRSDQLKFDYLEELIQIYSGDVTVIGIIGPQSSGKSYLLNRIFGVRHSVAASRCTDGIWCSFARIENNNFIILDCEGLFNQQKKESEEFMIVQCVTSVCDFTILNQDLSFNRSFNQIFKRLSESQKQLQGEALFKGQLQIIVRDVPVNDKEGAEEELISNIRSFMGSENNFIKTLFNSRLNTLLMCNHQMNIQFQEEVKDLRKYFCEQDTSKRWQGIRFLTSLKLILSQLELQDLNNLDELYEQRFSQQLRENALKLWNQLFKDYNSKISLNSDHIQNYECLKEHIIAQLKFDLTNTESYNSNMQQIDKQLQDLFHQKISELSRELPQLSKKLSGQTSKYQIQIIIKEFEDQSQQFKMCFEKCHHCYLKCPQIQSHVSQDVKERKLELTRLLHKMDIELIELKTILVNKDIRSVQQVVDTLIKEHQKQKNLIDFNNIHQTRQIAILKVSTLLMNSNLQNFNNNKGDNYDEISITIKLQDSRDYHQKLIELQDKCDSTISELSTQMLAVQDNKSTICFQVNSLNDIQEQLRLTYQKLMQDQASFEQTTNMLTNEISNLQIQIFKLIQQNTLVDYQNIRDVSIVDLIAQLSEQIQQNDLQINNIQIQLIQIQEQIDVKKAEIENILANLKVKFNIQNGTNIETYLAQEIQEIKFKLYGSLIGIPSQLYLQQRWYKRKNENGNISRKIDVYASLQIENKDSKINNSSKLEVLNDYQEFCIRQKVENPSFTQEFNQGQDNYEIDLEVQQQAFINHVNNNSLKQQEMFIDQQKQLLIRKFEYQKTLNLWQQIDDINKQVIVSSTKKTQVTQELENSYLQSSSYEEQLKINNQKIKDYQNQLMQMDLEDINLNHRTQGQVQMKVSCQEKIEVIQEVVDQLNLIQGLNHDLQQFCKLKILDQDTLALEQVKFSEIQIELNDQQSLLQTFSKIDNLNKLQIETKQELKGLDQSIDQLHDCRGNHLCKVLCQSCNKIDKICCKKSGHEGHHLCSDQQHSCNQCCQNKGGCDKKCQLEYSHNGPHNCCEIHQCKVKCEFCQEKCPFLVGDNHQQHCKLTKCVHKCFLCENKCHQDHKHSQNMALKQHLCKNEHACSSECSEKGKPVIGKQNHQCNNQHTCDNKCPECDAICSKPYGHDGKHDAKHRNKENQYFTANVSAEYQQIIIKEDGLIDRVYNVLESSTPETCNSSCARRSRSHFHLMECRGGNKCYAQRFPKFIKHSTSQYVGFKDKDFDEVLCLQFWEIHDWESPVQNIAIREVIGLCNFQCKVCKDSFCTDQAWHSRTYNFQDHNFACTELHTQETMKIQGIDIVFIMDTTGSMLKYREEVEQSIAQIFTKAITYNKSQDFFKFAFIGFNDHKKDENIKNNNISKPYIVQDFQNADAIIQLIKTQEFSGGGDAAEAVLDGLFAIQQVSWRNNSEKFAFLITDTFPHGKKYHRFQNSDDFYEGCPCGLQEEAIFSYFKNQQIHFTLIQLNDHLNITINEFKKYQQDLLVIKCDESFEFANSIYNNIVKQMASFEITYLKTKQNSNEERQIVKKN